MKQSQASRVRGKTVRLLAVGNSFSGNATAFLGQMAQAGGHQFAFGHACIGGCPLQKHWEISQIHEADPQASEGRPYKSQRTCEPVSLKQLLQEDAWEYVTIQQGSRISYDLGTYRPWAQQLAGYIRQYAPQAKLLFHETWAYRADDPLFQGGMTQQQMYGQLHEAYMEVGREIGIAGIIPVGTAFQNARRNLGWMPEFEPLANPAALVAPQLPCQTHSLNVGYSWDSSTQPATLKYDGHHASEAGQFLGAAVWYEFFFGDVRQNPFTPGGMPAGDAALLREVAHATVIGSPARRQG